MSGDGIEDRRIRERDLQIEYGLSIRESEVVAAREDGLTNVEIARLMGISRQSVSNVLSKARAKGVRLGHLPGEQRHRSDDVRDLSQL